jgi:hypothetical protein
VVPNRQSQSGDKGRIHSSFHVYDKLYTPARVKGYNPRVVELDLHDVQVKDNR